MEYYSLSQMAIDDKSTMVRPDFEVYHISSQVNHPVSLHHHDHYELYFFFQGDLKYSVESKTYALIPGDVLLISPTELHQPVFGSGDVAYIRLVIWISRKFLESFDNGVLARCFNMMGSGNNHKSNLLRLPQPVSNRLFEKALATYYEYAVGTDDLSSFAAQINLTSLLIEINRISPPVVEDVKEDPFLLKVMEFLSENLTNPLNLDYIADHFFMNKYHLHRKFQKYFNTSIHSYITQQRLILAKQLMYEGIPPQQVYTKCGYNDYSTFYRLFKNIYGNSPKDFYASVNS